MQSLELIEISQEAVWVLLKISSVVVIPGMIVGLMVSLFQALTQIQEMTLTFVPKVIVIFSFLLTFSSFIGNTLSTFTYEMLEKILTQ